MSTKACEVKLDIEELALLLDKAKRQRTKDVLFMEIKRLDRELAKLLDEKIEIQAASDDGTVQRSHQLSSNSSRKRYEIKLTNYAWDQTDEGIKLYVILTDVPNIPMEAINCHFGEKSIDLYVLDLNQKNYHLPINNLCEEIDVKKCYVKTKANKIIVFLAKKTHKLWSHVTSIEKRLKENKAQSIQKDMIDDSAPGDSLMNLIKKIYEDGDDEIKMTIAKAWTESR